jgi:hypothetical protein
MRVAQVSGRDAKDKICRKSAPLLSKRLADKRFRVLTLYFLPVN